MKVHKDYRGELDLEMRIEELTKRIKDLEDINDGHRKLNQELRKELQYYKEKSSEGESHKNLLQGYKKVIEDLSNKLARKDS
jgi:predicted RNase H-like nuclease (RuvC/YqgF family)